MDSRAHFIVRLARPQDGWVRLPELTARARRASEQLQAEGVGVRLLRSVFVPEDDTCFCIYDAGSAEDVREAALRAGLSIERMAEAVADPDGDERLTKRSERSTR